MPIREVVNRDWFNADIELPFELRLADFEIAMQDVYDFFFDVNTCSRTKAYHDLRKCYDRQICQAPFPT